MNDFASRATAMPPVGGSMTAGAKPAAGAKGRGRGGSRAEWFAAFAAETIMPMLERAADNLRRHGFGAGARLDRASGRLVAELEVVPPRLPAGARPPRLVIAASRPPREQNPSRDRPLLVESTGTFPNAGVTGGFAGEVDYTTIYPATLEEKIAEFVDAATA